MGALFDLSAAGFSESSAALSVTLSPESVGLLSCVLVVAMNKRYLWASDGEELTDAEHEALTDALDLLWKEFRIDDAP